MRDINKFKVGDVLAFKNKAMAHPNYWNTVILILDDLAESYYVVVLACSDAAWVGKLHYTKKSTIFESFENV